MTDPDPRCVYIDHNHVCGGAETDAIHGPAYAFATRHPFTPPTPDPRSAGCEDHWDDATQTLHCNHQARAVLEVAPEQVEPDTVTPGEPERNSARPAPSALAEAIRRYRIAQDGWVASTAGWRLAEDLLAEIDALPDNPPAVITILARYREHYGDAGKGTAELAAVQAQLDAAALAAHPEPGSVEP